VIRSHYPDICGS